MCAGFFLTVFAPNIVYLYFSYGVLVGLYLPSASNFSVFFLLIFCWLVIVPKLCLWFANQLR